MTHGEASTVNTAGQTSYAEEHLGNRGTHSARRGTRWGMQRRMFGWAGDVRYAPNMSALAVNVTREGPQTGAHKQGVEHSPTTNPSW